jgi:hypothetical protein
MGSRAEHQVYQVSQLESLPFYKGDFISICTQYQEKVGSTQGKQVSRPREEDSSSDEPSKSLVSPKEVRKD